MFNVSIENVFMWIPL